MWDGDGCRCVFAEEVRGGEKKVEKKGRRDFSCSSCEKCEHWMCCLDAKSGKVQGVN